MVRPAILKGVVFGGVRQAAANIVEHPYFVRFITGLIVLNAITLGLETDDMIAEKFGSILYVFDIIVLSLFGLELLLKFTAYHFHFFRSGWNIFDLIVIGIALIPSSGPFAILRALRILRVLRLMSVVPPMRRIVTALFHALPGMGAIIAVLLLIYYVAAVLATEIFGHHPDPEMKTLFGSIGASMYTLFQLMTLEGWAENIANPTIVHFPWAWVFFVGFIVITSFSVLNLFIGIIVDAMNIVHEEEHQEEKDALQKTRDDDNLRLQHEINALRNDVAEIKQLLLRD